MIAGTLMLTSQDAVSKYLTTDYHFGEIFFYRGIWAYVPLAFFVWRAGGLAVLRSREPGVNMIRALLNTAAGVLIISALALLPIADVFAIVFLSPLIVTALSPWMLGEAVGWRRWSAVLVGFAGVLVMTRPGGAGIGWLVLLPLGVAVVMALRDILTRRLGAHDSTVTILMYTVTVSVGFGGLTMLWTGTTMPPLEHWAIFIVAGLINGTAHFLTIRAFQLVAAAVVSPFKYLSIVWAAVLGFVIWGDVPDAYLICGAVLVVGSGLYTLHRETRRKKLA